MCIPGRRDLSLNEGEKRGRLLCSFQLLPVEEAQRVLPPQSIVPRMMVLVCFNIPTHSPYLSVRSPAVLMQISLVCVTCQCIEDHQHTLVLPLSAQLSLWKLCPPSSLL